MIRTEQISIGEVSETLKNWFSESPNDRDGEYFENLHLDESLVSLLAQLRSDLIVLIEYPYTDRVYRDSYYAYYAKKLARYPRDCFKLSFFDPTSSREFKKIIPNQERVQRAFRGFTTLRPARVGHAVGRTVISPTAYAARQFATMVTKVETSVYGLKLKAEGFPYSSQDTEAMKCAETSVWALLEYYGSKYPEYRPVLPSAIHSTLRKTVTQRQVPSEGLSPDAISYVLKRMGFGTRIYGEEGYSSKQLCDVANVYVDSGIPVLTCVLGSNEVGHTFLLVGKYPTTGERPAGQNDNWFVTIDDNHSPYQRRNLQRLSSGIPGSSTKRGKQSVQSRVDYLIVPLHEKIFLEAYTAGEFLERLPQLLPKLFTKDQLPDRYFLASSRSFKNHVLLGKAAVDEDLRDILLTTPLPKFIWVAEYGRKEDARHGLVLLDATEPDTTSERPLILAAVNSKLYWRELSRRTTFRLPSRPFKSYHNLTWFGD